jgi:hypothetical protein
MGKVGAWLAGILATVIGGYAVWYFTRPPAVTTFEGMVYAGDAPVSKALVAVDLSGNAGANGAVHDVTDENGAYRIEFTGLPTGSGATLTVSATGYQNTTPRSVMAPLQTDIHVDFPLDALPAPPAPTPPSPTPPGPSAPVQHPVRPPSARIPRYIPKLAAQAKKFTVPQK